MPNSRPPQDHHRLTQLLMDVADPASLRAWLDEVHGVPADLLEAARIAEATSTGQRVDTTAAQIAEVERLGGQVPTTPEAYASWLASALYREPRSLQGMLGRLRRKRPLLLSRIAEIEAELILEDGDLDVVLVRGPHVSDRDWQAVCSTVRAVAERLSNVTLTEASHNTTAQGDVAVLVLGEGDRMAGWRSSRPSMVIATTHTRLPGAFHLDTAQGHAAVSMALYRWLTAPGSPPPQAPPPSRTTLAASPGLPEPADSTFFDDDLPGDGAVGTPDVPRPEGAPTAGLSPVQIPPATGPVPTGPSGPSQGRQVSSTASKPATRSQARVGLLVVAGITLVVLAVATNTTWHVLGPREYIVAGSEDPPDPVPVDTDATAPSPTPTSVGGTPVVDAPPAAAAKGPSHRHTILTAALWLVAIPSFVFFLLLTLSDRIRLPPKHRPSRYGLALLSDRPAGTDRLRFGPHIDAVAEALVSEETRPPLTVAIEGPWGSGKSTFLSLLADELDAHHGRDARIVRFNAWRYTSEEAVWAAFALEVVKELRRPYAWYQRLLLDLKLWRNRHGVSFMLNAWLVIAVICGALGVLVVDADLMLSLVTLGLADDTLQNATALQIGRPLAALLASATLVWRYLPVAAGASLDPLSTALKRVTSGPDYEGKIPFLEHFHEDFRDVVDTYAPDRRVYVLVDDLDRCPPDQVGELVRALHLMFAEHDRLIFLLAFDRDKVVGALAHQLQKLRPFLADGEDGDARDLGHAFLEKIVQVTLNVPAPADQDLVRMFSREAPTSSPLDAAELVAREVLGEQLADPAVLLDMVSLVADSLDQNPRRAKRFVNAWQLQRRIALASGWMDPEHNRPALTHHQLAKFVALTQCWPDLVRALAHDPSLLGDLQAAALGRPREQISRPQEDSTWRRWSAEQGLLDLLARRVQGDVAHQPTSETCAYALGEVPLVELLGLAANVETREGS